MEKLYPGVPQFACFDTAFHTTMPEAASRLPLPKKYWDAGIRKYGFHGLSCESIVHPIARPFAETSDRRASRQRRQHHRHRRWKIRRYDDGAYAYRRDHHGNAARRSRSRRAAASAQRRRRRQDAREAARQRVGPARNFRQRFRYAQAARSRQRRATLKHNWRSRCLRARRPKRSADSSPRWGNSTRSSSPAGSANTTPMFAPRSAAEWKFSECNSTKTQIRKTRRRLVAAIARFPCGHRNRRRRPDRAPRRRTASVAPASCRRFFHPKARRGKRAKTKETATTPTNR